MAAEDSGVCQLHGISEDSVSSGHGATSGIYKKDILITSTSHSNFFFSVAVFIDSIISYMVLKGEDDEKLFI